MARHYLQGKSVALVEDDIDVAEALVDALGMGGAEVSHFSEGLAAWDAICQKSFDIVVTDWNMPGLNGLALFNRLRQTSTYSMRPVIIISGYLSERDGRLLEEHPFTGFIEKPVTLGHLENTLQRLVSEETWYNHASVKIQKLIDGKDVPEKTIDSLLMSSPNPLPIGLFLSRFFRSRNKRGLAMHVLNKLRGMSPNSVGAMTELGMMLLEEGENNEAAKILVNAHKLSPANLGRMCLLAKLNLEHMKLDKAQEIYEKALHFDNTYPDAQEGVKSIQSVQDFLKKNPNEIITRSYSSLMNSLGIMSVREQNFTAAIEYYERAWQCTFQKKAQCRLAFNLALAHYRNKSLNEAVFWLRKTISLTPESSSKAHQLLDDILKAHPNLDKIADPAGTPVHPSKSAVTTKPGTQQQVVAKHVDEEEMILGEERPTEEIRIHPAVPGRPETDRERLQRLIPDLKVTFEVLEKKGIYLQPHIQGISKLIEEHGINLVTKAVGQVLHEPHPSYHRIRDLCQQLRQSA